MYSQDSSRTRILLVSALVGIVVVFLFSIIFFNVLTANQALSTTTTLSSPTAKVSTPGATPAPTPTPIPTPTPVPTLPTIVNAGFETPTLGNNFQYNITDNAWKFNGAAGGGSGITGNQSGFTAANPNAPEGTQVAFIQTTGTISQNLHFFNTGKYIINFQAAQRVNFQHGGEDFQVLIDGTVIGNFSPGDGNYTTFANASFPITVGDHILTFQGIDSKGGDNSVFIDTIGISFA